MASGDYPCNCQPPRVASTRRCEPDDPYKTVRKLVELMENPISCEAFDRHQLLLNDFLAACPYAFWVRDLPFIMRLIELLLNRVDKVCLYRDPTKSLLSLCALPPMLTRASEALAFSRDLQEYFSFLGYLLVRIRRVKRRDLVLHALSELLQRKAPVLSCCVKLETCYEAVEASQLPNVIGQLLELSDDVFYVKLLELSSVLVNVSHTVCQKMVSAKAIETLMLRLEPNWNTRVAHLPPPDPGENSIVSNHEITVKLLWTLLHAVKEASPEFKKNIEAPNVRALWSFRYALLAFTLRKNCEVIRNHLTGILLLCLNNFHDMDLVGSGLSMDIALLGTATELGAEGTWASQIRFTTSDLDYDFKKMLLLAMCYCAKLPDIKIILPPNIVLPALLRIVTPELGITWHPQQHNKLISLALHTLHTLVPQMSDEFLHNDGPLRLLMMMECFSFEQYDLPTMKDSLKFLNFLATGDEEILDNLQVNDGTSILIMISDISEFDDSDKDPDYVPSSVESSPGYLEVLSPKSSKNENSELNLERFPAYLNDGDNYSHLNRFLNDVVHPPARSASASSEIPIQGQIVFTDFDIPKDNTAEVFQNNSPEEKQKSYNNSEEIREKIPATNIGENITNNGEPSDAFHMADSGKLPFNMPESAWDSNSGGISKLYYQMAAQNSTNQSQLLALLPIICDKVVAPSVSPIGKYPPGAVQGHPNRYFDIKGTDTICDNLLSKEVLTMLCQQCLAYGFSILECLFKKHPGRTTSSVNLCLKFMQRVRHPNASDPVLNPNFLICAFDFLWESVVWCDNNLQLFISSGGVFTLLDIIQKSIFPVKLVALGALVDMCDEGSCVPHLVTWRKHGQTLIPMLLQLFREENLKLGVKVTATGSISDMELPLMGHQQWYETFYEKKNPNSSPATVDLLGSCRPKIYAIIQLLNNRHEAQVAIANERYQLYGNSNLSTLDQITLLLAENFLALKLGEAWIELAKDIEESGLRPLIVDGDVLSLLKRRLYKWSEHIQVVQEKLLDREIKNDSKDERHVYKILRDSKLIESLKALHELDYIARTTERMFRLVTKMRNIKDLNESLHFTEGADHHKTYMSQLKVTPVFGHTVNIQSDTIIDPTNQEFDLRPVSSDSNSTISEMKPTSSETGLEEEVRVSVFSK